jgi:Ca2+-binding EF-hand superfamily protein
MQKFSGATKFTKSITSLLVGLTADKNDLQILKTAFAEIDEDGDG